VITAVFRWSDGEADSIAGMYEPGNRCCQRRLILDTGCSCRWSTASLLNSQAATMAALVVLTGCLPGHAEPSGDLWPPDAQTDGMIDEHRKFRFCRLPREAGALDALEHLGWRQPRNVLPVPLAVLLAPGAVALAAYA